MGTKTYLNVGAAVSGGVDVTQRRGAGYEFERADVSQDVAAPVTSTDITSELWCPPAIAHPNDREMLTFPAGWSMFKRRSDGSGIFDPHVPVYSTDESQTYHPPAYNNGESVILATTQKRRSWLNIAPPIEGSLYFYGFLCPLTTSNTFRSRIHVPYSLGHGFNNGNNIRLGVWGDNHGAPKQEHVWRVGWEMDDSDMYFTAGSIGGNGSGTIGRFSNICSTGAYMDGEVVLRSGGGNWQGIFLAPGLSIDMGSSAFFDSHISSGQTAWVGFDFFCKDSAWPSTNFQSPPTKIDYFRQEDGGEFWA